MIDHVFYPNASGNFVVPVNEGSEQDDLVFASETRVVDVTVRDLLEASIVKRFQGLRLRDGRQLEIIPKLGAYFIPLLSADRVAR